MSWNTLPPKRRRHAETVLSDQQLRILKHRLDGHSARTIATALTLDESTVRYHLRRIADLLDEQPRKDAA